MSKPVASSTSALGPTRVKEDIKIEIPQSFPRRHYSHSQENEEMITRTVVKNDKCGCYRTTIAFLFVFTGMIFNLIILSIVHERVPLDIIHPLPDLGFDLFPEVDWVLAIAEYIIVIYSALVLLLLAIHRHRVIIFRRLCLIMGIIYLYRGVCMISTVYPLANRNYHCEPQLSNSTNPVHIPFGEYVGIIASRVGHMLLGFGLSINGFHNYCGDYLFSGHTAILTLGYLILREYLMPSRCRTIAWKLFHAGLFISSFAGVICIIIARGHYLIDIILAYFVTSRVFWIYHTLVYNHFLMFTTQTNYLSRLWWFKMFLYFEECKGIAPFDQQNCQTCICESSNLLLPRSFEWPLPWPRFLRRRNLLGCQQRLLN